MATLSAFTAINGYDERITKYGYDDSHLYAQLQRVAGGEPRDLTRVSATGESLIEHVEHPYTVASPARARSNRENRIGVGIAESMQPWKDHVRSSYTEDLRATHETRARFGAGALVGGASGGGGAGGVKVNYFVHKVESWVPDLSEVIGAARWTQVEAEAAAQRAADAAAAAVAAAATSP
jgi:hypothetical protein